MAEPFIVTSQIVGPPDQGFHSLPTQAQPGDLILTFLYSNHRMSDQAVWNGTHARSNISNAIGGSVVATAGSSWLEQLRPSVYRGWSYRTTARAATVPADPAAVAITHRSGKDSASVLTLVVVRNAAGVGATSTGQWSVPVQDSQSIGVFAGRPSNLADGVGVTELEQRVWWAPGSGSTAGPGGNIPPKNGRYVPHLLGLEILGTTGPGQPILIEPADGSQAANDVPVELAWAHQPARQGGRQDAYILEITHLPEDPNDDPVTRWWDGVSLVNVETVVDSPQSRVTLPPSALGTDQMVSWTVATREALDGEWSLHAPPFSFSTVEPPTVTVTGPTGAVHNTMRPVVTWDGAAAAGEVLVGYQVRITNGDGTAVYDTDPQTGSPGQHAVPALGTWVNGNAYTPWARVRQSGGAWSAWEQGEPFVVSWDEPQTPTVEAWADGPGVLVQAAAPGLLAAEVERVNPDGTISPVDVEAAGGVTRDVLAPYGTTVTYRARTSNTIADVTVYSEWAESGPVQSRDRYGYLADAANPARWVRLRQATASGYTPYRQYETEYGLGDTRGMVNKGPQLGDEGTLTVRTDTIEEERELLDMLETVDRLIIRWPAEQRYAGSSQTWHDRGTTLIAVNGGPRVDPLSENYPLTSRLIDFDWIEQ